MNYYKKKLQDKIKGLLLNRSKPGYSTGHIRDRLLELRYHCQNSKYIDKSEALDVLKEALNTLDKLQTENFKILRDFDLIEMYSNHKIAEYMGVKQIGDEIFSINSIKFDSCLFSWYCLVALVGIKKRRK